ncbi:MAG: ATP-binding protein [Bacteroidales bacterium]|nr:ATP-binding protein [Bacteroidales bacterium]
MIKRDIYDDKITAAFAFLPIVVLSGARQVGKTTIMNNFNYKKKKLFLNGQNPEVIEIFSKYSIIENYLKINLDINLDGFLLIDEFQFIPNISTVLKLLTDNNKMLKVIATGSSSLDIIQKVEESLAGRVRIINVYPLSFSEFIKFQNEELYFIYQKYNELTVDSIIDKEIKLLEFNYLTYGGLPRVALANNISDKIELLNDIYLTYLLRDVKSYIKNEDSVGFNKMLRILSSQISNLLNVNELSKTSGLNYKKTIEYLFLLEQMFIIKMVEPFHTNKRNTITKMKKVFFYDLGIRNIIYNSFNDILIRVDNGAIFENYVFMELVKNVSSTSNIFFYRTHDNAEIDFVIDNMIEKITIEAKFKSLDKPSTFKSLQEFNSREGVSKSYLINLDYNYQQNGIHYLPSCLLSKISAFQRS